MRGQRRLGLLAAVASLVLSGCMAGGTSEAMVDYDRAEARSVAGSAEPVPEFSQSQAMPLVTERLEDAPADDTSSDSSLSAPEAPEQRPQRLRVFSATIELSVASVDHAREELLSMAEETGGYVESSQQDYLVLRIPAARFDATVEGVGRIGEVLSRYIETADVTDQFVDLGRRLEIAQAARDRLYQLLERTSDSDEQVAILREIRRLTEEIEQISGRLDSLGRLIEYSRISIRLYPRLAGEDVLLERIPFPWIAVLDPLTPTIGRARRPFDTELPADFARFSEGRLIRAESADGVRVRLGSRENAPEGDAAFWREALLFHRGPMYAAATPFEVGRFLAVSFESRDTDPYVYWVLVSVRDRELVVAEVFFPSLAALEEYRDELLGWFEEVLP